MPLSLRLCNLSTLMRKEKRSGLRRFVQIRMDQGAECVDGSGGCKTGRHTDPKGSIDFSLVLKQPSMPDTSPSFLTCGAQMFFKAQNVRNKLICILL